MQHTPLSRGGEDGGEVEDLAQLGVGQDVLLVDRGVLVTDEVEETLLVVNDEEDGLVLVKTLVLEGRHCDGGRGKRWMEEE